MTIIVTIASYDGIIQISDRRINIGGKPIDDEALKATLVETTNGRFGVAFTGLAELRTANFKTQDWLLKVLGQSSPGSGVEDVLNFLMDKAREEFPESAIPTTFVASGYRLGEPFRFVLSNDAAVTGKSDAFEFMRDDFSPPIAWAGTTLAAKPEFTEELHKMVEQGRAYTEITAKAVSDIRKMADAPKSGGTIGKQLNSIFIPKDAAIPTVTHYHSERLETVAAVPNWISITSKPTLALGGIQVSVVMETTEGNVIDVPLHIPKTHRNSPCGCGSGVRYRDCHGKMEIK